MSSFPEIAPTARSYDPGDWPVKSFRANNGTEHRIIYGSIRADSSLSLTYSNIPDSVAESFINHYQSIFGTFQTFTLPSADRTIGKGWAGSAAFFNAGYKRMWRYAEPPQLTSVVPGVSSVSIKLIGVVVS